MPQLSKKIFMPTRNVIVSLLPLAIVAWYFINKLEGRSTFLKFMIIVAAVTAQAIIVYVSSWTRHKRQPVFWRIYDLLTGNGRIPMRLLASAIVLIIFWGLCFEFSSGLQPTEGAPKSFIVRFIEVDLFWSLLNFLGTSDETIKAQGFSKFLTVLTAISGLLFWGMYISILVNKFIELESPSGKNTLDE